LTLVLVTYCDCCRVWVLCRGYHGRLGAHRTPVSSVS